MAGSLSDGGGPDELRGTRRCAAKQLCAQQKSRPEGRLSQLILRERSVRRFQRLLSRMGIDTALKEAGVSDGDTVVIGDYELEWQE